MSVIHQLGVFALFLSASAFAGEAPQGDKNLPSVWSSGVKQIFGTSYEAYDSSNRYSGGSATAPISKVWFTGSQGVVSEVFWPSIDMPQVRDSQLLVTDGKTFLFEERRDSETTVEWIKTGVPAFKVRNRDPKRRFEIERTIFTDPDRNVLLQKIKINRFTEGLHFYLLHNPSVGNTPLGNSGRVSLGTAAPGAGLFAWQGEQYQAVVLSIPIKSASAGFALVNDGWTDLSREKKLVNRYNAANFGDVVLTAELDIPTAPGSTELDIAIGFDKSLDGAYKEALSSLATDIESSLKKYVAQWQSYQSSIRDLSGVSGDGGKLFRSSIAIMKSTEDKTHPGAYVASPSIPWGLKTLSWTKKLVKGQRCFQGNPELTPTVGYHLVWPRDLYQVATSFMAVDDPHSALAALDFLKGAQFGPRDGEWNFDNKRRYPKDGSFPQNAWTDGEVCWSGLQMDEVAMPILLAYRMWQAGHVRALDYWDMVQRAADFIVGFGPWSPMERWEEVQGVAPSTVAAQITALRGASELARAAGDVQRAGDYRATAEAWASKPGDNIDTWTFTTSGGHGNGRYYVRIEAAGKVDQTWDPNDGATFYMANHAGEWKEKDVVDGGFLELVRFGIKPALDRHIVDSINVYDRTIRVDVKGKYPGFHRYLADRYNYDENTGEEQQGMLWPFLSGERGHYELQKALEQGKSPLEVDAAMQPYIAAMEAFATPTFMLPEQVYNNAGPVPGGPTGAATPLGWTHGEYVKLLRSRMDRTVYDRVEIGF